MPIIMNHWIQNIRPAKWVIVVIYRVGQKTGPQTHDHNCQILSDLQIFSLEDFLVNLQLNAY